MLMEIFRGPYNRGMAQLVLDKVLKTHGMSKRQFAKALGVDYASVFRFFRPGYDPKLSMLGKWADVLGVRIRDLFADPREKKRRGSAAAP